MRCVAGVCRDRKLAEIDRKLAKVLRVAGGRELSERRVGMAGAGTGTWSAGPAAVTISTATASKAPTGSKPRAMPSQVATTSVRPMTSSAAAR